MRILDNESDLPINRITLFLTLTEASELRDSVDALLGGGQSHHEHVPSEDFKKEITITIYDSQPIDSFDDRSRRLIVNDE